MNELIFMMWLADVVSVSQGMGFLAMVAIFISIVWAVFHAVAKRNDDESIPKPSKLLISLGLVLAMTAWLMPSKQTIYAAVALKAGQEIVESNVGKKAVGAIEAILDEVIAKK